MEEIEIKLILRYTDGAIAFIEFTQNQKSKILSYENFKKRFGTERIEDLK